MSRSIYDKQLVRWVKSHHWDSLEKDKDIILRHIRTFAGGDVEQENAEALKPSHNSASTPFCDNCVEPHCLVSLDGTCEMIRIYLNAKRRA
jgi:hypothetical protein